jgi:UDP-glucose:tetrahydrobiopterin glucosyltransferase
VRVVLVAPLVSVIDERSPQLGGAQALLADLACGLAAAGHDVTLLAASGSFVRGVRVPDLAIESARLVPVRLHRASPRRDDAAQRDAFARVAAWTAAHADAIDVIHAHAYDAPAFDSLENARRPVVHTLHLPPVDPVVVEAARASRAAKVTVSRANAASWSARGVTVREVIHNGVDIGVIPRGSGRGGYLLAAGRIAPEKGIDIAARVARAVRMPLWVAGADYDEEARRTIEPTGVRFLGPVPRGELFRIMGEAAALVMPVRWDEPFGLVAVEAMAAGTPVVAYRRGGLAEVVDDGRTGFLVEPDDETAFVEAVARIGSLDRDACRARVGERFSLERMVAAYSRLYASL